MTAWDIDVPGVGGVVQRVSDVAAGYQGDLQALDAATGAAAAALRCSPLVVSRLGEFVQEAAQPHLARVIGHTDSAIAGTVDAVTFYQAGDEEMAARAQRHAVLASYPVGAPGVAGGGGRP